MKLTPGEETLLIMIAQLMVTFGHGYLYSGQERLLVLLEKYHGYVIKRRMLGYILASLIKKGLIRRRSRNQRLHDGSIEPLTTLTFITKKGHKLLANKIKQLLRAAGKVVKKILTDGWMRNPQPAEQPLSREDSKEKARELQAHLAYI